MNYLKILPNSWELKDLKNVLENLNQDILLLNLCQLIILVNLLMNGIGEMLMDKTIFHGVETNIFQFIVDHAGLMEQQVPLLIESTF